MHDSEQARVILVFMAGSVFRYMSARVGGPVSPLSSSM